MSWNYPAKIFVRMSIFDRNNIYRGFNIKVQISAHKDGRVSFSLLFLCASRKTHRQTVSASAVNLLRQKRKKHTLAETLPLVNSFSYSDFFVLSRQLQNV